ncbi:MAG: cytochrome c biogenesis CcdA family protein [Candidatus Thermoplasmatota archaeon]|nr:cytochrome c biogenesis CcdA family protein [Candidatus Thermoplasmatota archaeon]
MVKASKAVMIATSAVLIVFLLGFASYMFWSDIREVEEQAPDFEMVLPDGNRTSLRNLSGSVILLHFTNIENPVCLECEVELKEQTVELEKALGEDEDLIIITVNMRKNSFSDPGYELAERWWGVNVTWIWIEDFEPFTISGKYIDYWSVGSESANPTLLLVNEEQDIVGIYHIYQMGKGKVYDVMDSDEIVEKADRIRSGDWEGVEGQRRSMGGGSVMGMFVLGIITSFSPCCIALLFTVFTFIVSTGPKGQAQQGTEKRAYKGSSLEGLAIGFSFIVGMALVFFIIGLFISRVGIFINNARYFDLGAGAILVILGLNNLFSFYDVMKENVKRIFRIGEGNAEGSLKQTSILSIRELFWKSPTLGAFLLGILFSFGLAPCAVSLVLPVVVWILSQDISMLMGGILFLSFGIGHGLIFIPLAVGTRSFSAGLTDKFVSIGKWVKIVFGIVVVAMGVVFALRFFGIKFW